MSSPNLFQRFIWRSLRAVGLESLSWDLEFKSGRWGADARSSVITDRVIALCQGGKLIEFGCGYGDLPRSVPACTFSSYTGIDISPYAIQEAERRAAIQGLQNCSFIATDMASWVGDQHVKLIVLEECLMYLKGKKLDDFLARCCDSLVPGGLIFVTIFSATKHADTIASCRRVCHVEMEELVGTRTFLLLRQREK